jgi:hypothetical protein
VEPPQLGDGLDVPERADGLLDVLADGDDLLVGHLDPLGAPIDGEHDRRRDVALLVVDVGHVLVGERLVLEVPDVRAHVAEDALLADDHGELAEPVDAAHLLAGGEDAPVAQHRRDDGLERVRGGRRGDGDLRGGLILELEVDGGLAPAPLHAHPPCGQRQLRDRLAREQPLRAVEDQPRGGEGDAVVAAEVDLGGDLLISDGGGDPLWRLHDRRNTPANHNSRGSVRVNQDAYTRCCGRCGCARVA